MVKIQSQIPPIGKGKRGEDGYLGYLLRQAANTYQNRANQALSDLDVTSVQFSVLTILSAYPGHSGADIARVALLTPQTVSVIVANLEKSELVERHAHPIHGRIQNLELTKKGRSILAKAKKRMYELEKQLASELTAEDERIIRKWLVATAVASETR